MKTLIIIAILFSVQDPPMLISRSEAAQILGQEVRIAGPNVESENAVAITRIEYRTLEKDPAGKDIVLYVKSATYPAEREARQFMVFIWDQNASWDDRNRLECLGDEAVYHTDNENFYVVILRKGKTVHSLKINKLTKKADTKKLLRILETV